MTPPGPPPAPPEAPLSRLVRGAVHHRRLVLGLSLCAVVAAAALARGLKLDALPDVTNNQVLVLTRAPGLTPEEVERLVTRPIEAVLGGAPGLQEQRSLSRYGLSFVTAVFSDDTPPYLARQVTQERLVTAQLPEGVEPPELGPLTGGLGEIFHFTIGSDRRGPAELLELATLKIAPLLRAVPGVVEVNTWGGARRTLEVRADAAALAQRGLPLSALRDALREATGSVAGASVPAGARQTLLRGVAWPRDPSELGGAIIPAAGPGGPGEAGDAPRPRVADVAEVREGTAPRIGAATQNGRGETVYLMAQMLRGENALQVLGGLHERMETVRRLLPPDVHVEIVYDRGELVRATLRTVGKNLLEGGALVIGVLLLTLGSLRAGVLVALCIPLSMLGATALMALLDLPGNLMSLGAIDFGLIVDGAVVMVEGLFHAAEAQGAGAHGAGAGDLADTGAATHVERIGAACGRLASPVFFSVLIILLVYVPVLGLGGTEGKLFRPMALTVLFAMGTALLLSLLVVPAAAASFLRPADLRAGKPLLVRATLRAYQPALRRAVAHPRLVALFGAAALALGVILYLRAGSEFVPQLDEGDLVVQTTRAADIDLESAVRDAGRMEAAVLAAVPEVTRVASRIGSPAVATDVMGIEQADVFVGVRPRDAWRPELRAEGRDGLIRAIEEALRRGAPGGAPSFTQPIEMRFNEILAGAVSDVTLAIYGDDLGELRRLSERYAALIEKEPGAADVRVLAPPAVSLLEVRPRPLDAAQAGFTVREVLEAVQAVRTGVEVGVTYDGPVRIPILLRLGGGVSAFTLQDLQLPTRGGGAVPLSRVADVTRRETPSLVSHYGAQRRLLVGFNVRGADLGGVVAGAQRRVAAAPPPAGYRLEWGGQYETLEQARARLLVLVPVVLLLILLVLLAAFHRLRPALIIFTHVPFACVGGVVALWARGMPVSIAAAVGFIALSGVAVLNGVVLMSQILENERAGLGAAEAARQAAESRARPVLMTALVASLGFLPMMLARGVGAEVQRPLATVVVGGLCTSTLLTLLILPSLYPAFAGLRARKEARS